jgi:hypothetical protein
MKFWGFFGSGILAINSFKRESRGKGKIQMETQKDTFTAIRCMSVGVRAKKEKIKRGKKSFRLFEKGNKEAGGRR